MKTELKTLKDIPFFRSVIHLTGQIVDENSWEDLIKKDLRAEAIKWVKYQNLCINITKMCHADQAEKSEAVRNWIKHFFNITEEDLK